jgi:hypothetical protein
VAADRQWANGERASAGLSHDACSSRRGAPAGRPGAATGSFGRMTLPLTLRARIRLQAVEQSGEEFADAGGRALGGGKDVPMVEWLR